MNRWLYSHLYVPLVTRIGDIMVAFEPPAVREKQIRDVLESVRPGDVIGRGFDAYLDGYLIPGNYGITHTGIARTSQHMTHAVAEGVVPIGVMDFIKDADRVVILRPRYPSEASRFNAIDAAAFLVDVFESDDPAVWEYDFLFNDDTKYYCHELTAHCLCQGGIFLPKTCGKFGPWPFRTYRELYLADMMIDNPSMDVVYQYRLKRAVIKDERRYL
jgi:hypothetical protein